MFKLHGLNFELASHPPYFLDMTPSDFFLFRNLNICLVGKPFLDQDVITAVNDNILMISTKTMF